MKIHWSIKVLYTLFVIVLIPQYIRHHGWGNFLWFSDIALLTTVPALWLESRLLASMMFLCAGLFDTIWILDLFCSGAFGFHLTGGTQYMFDSSDPLYLRNLSLFHVILPPLLLLMIARLGYDRRALRYQTLVAWIVFPITYFCTAKEANINWTQGPGVVMDWQHPLLWLLFIMIMVPGVIYVILHRVLNHFFGQSQKDLPPLAG